MAARVPVLHMFNYNAMDAKAELENFPHGHITYLISLTLWYQNACGVQAKIWNCPAVSTPKKPKNNLSAAQRERGKIAIPAASYPVPRDPGFALPLSCCTHTDKAFKLWVFLKQWGWCQPSLKKKKSVSESSSRLDKGLDVMLEKITIHSARENNMWTLQITEAEERLY